MGKRLPVITDSETVIRTVEKYGRVTKFMRNYYSVTVRFAACAPQEPVDERTARYAHVCAEINKLVVRLLPYCHTTSVCTFLVEVASMYDAYLRPEIARSLFNTLCWHTEFEDDECLAAVTRFYALFRAYLAPVYVVPTVHRMCTFAASSRLLSVLHRHGLTLDRGACELVSAHVSLYRSHVESHEVKERACARGILLDSTDSDADATRYYFSAVGSAYGRVPPRLETYEVQLCESYFNQPQLRDLLKMQQTVEGMSGL